MPSQEPSPSAAGNYVGGVQYWSTQPASVDGVLGGYGVLSARDALSSRIFLLTVMQGLSTVALHKRTRRTSASNGASPPRDRQNSKGKSTPRTRALDVGSGIGRVTANVLLPLVDSVDVVEPVEHFVREALRAAQAKEWKSLHMQQQAEGTSKPSKLVRFYKAGLQDFRPDAGEENEKALIGTLGDAAEREPAGYDVVWCQWCLGHLSDDELVEWLKNCKASLRNPGESVIVVKENVTHPENERKYDDDDQSWTRSTKLFKEIFARAGLTLVREELQRGFPEELFGVWMWALR